MRWRGADLHPAAKYRFHPRYGWTMAPDGWRINGLLETGFRSPVMDPEDGGRPRVLILGDSFSVAVEQTWRRSFAGELDFELASRGGRVANLSAGGWGTSQEYRALLDEGLAWRPDVVVLQVFPYNDLCNNSMALAFTCSWQDYLRPYYVPTSEGIELTWLHPWRARARAWSRIFGLVEKQVHWRRLGSPGNSPAEFRLRTSEFTRANSKALGLGFEAKVYSLMPDSHQPEPVRAAWRTTEALIEGLYARLAERGIPLIAVVVPFSKTFGSEWQEFLERHKAPLEPDYGTRRTEAVFSRLGVPVVSVRERIEAEGLEPARLFNRVNRHLSAFGHQRVAAWIGEELEELGF